MLTVIPVASTAIGPLATACRIAGTGSQRVDEVTLSAADRPIEGDEVVECGAEARVFLDPDAAIQLTDHILDALQDSAIAFRFSLRSKGTAHWDQC